MTLFAPERIDGMITALLQNYKEGGWLPKWPNPSYTNIMIGTHADSLIAEAIRKGFTASIYSSPMRQSTRTPTRRPTATRRGGGSIGSPECPTKPAPA